MDKRAAQAIELAALTIIVVTAFFVALNWVSG